MYLLTGFIDGFLYTLQEHLGTTQALQGEAIYFRGAAISDHVILLGVFFSSSTIQSSFFLCLWKIYIYQGILYLMLICSFFVLYYNTIIFIIFYTSVALAKNRLDFVVKIAQRKCAWKSFYKYSCRRTLKIAQFCLVQIRLVIMAATVSLYFVVYNGKKEDTNNKNPRWEE